MKIARIENNAVTDYPYALRGGERSAKRLHPDVWPLPADWSQATPEQKATLQAVEVLPSEQPEGAREGTPAFVDGAWRQTWVERPAHDPQTQTVRWDGSQWVVEALPPPPVPESVPAHHIRRALSAAGLRAQVEAAIAALPEGHKMRDDWEYAPTIRRDSIGVETLRVGLGLTAEQVDAVFIVAGEMQT